jgi:hypothetical protein
MAAAERAWYAGGGEDIRGRNEAYLRGVGMGELRRVLRGCHGG